MFLIARRRLHVDRIEQHSALSSTIGSSKRKVQEQRSIKKQTQHQTNKSNRAQVGARERRAMRQQTRPRTAVAPRDAAHSATSPPPTPPAALLYPQRFFNKKNKQAPPCTSATASHLERPIVPPTAHSTQTKQTNTRDTSRIVDESHRVMIILERTRATQAACRLHRRVDTAPSACRDAASPIEPTISISPTPNETKRSGECSNRR